VTATVNHADKSAQTDYPIQDVLAQRYSPRAFASTPVERETLLSLLEAARWSPSSRNAQPWRFIVATKDNADAYNKLLSVLNENNQRWASTAPVLMLAIAEVEVPGTGRTNSKALYDLGQAVAHFTVEATARDLYLRQMGGIHPDKAAEIYNVPEGYQVVVAIALGYRAAADVLPDDLAARERDATRSRQPLNALVFGDDFGTESDLFE
jgi:nitroreductase